MTNTQEIHRRALSAAIAVVGRQRHRAGVLAMGAMLTTGLGCLPDKDGVGSASASESESASEGTTEDTEAGATTVDDTALSDATGMTEADSDTDWMTSGSATEGEGSTGTDTGDSTSASGTGSTTDDTDTDTDTSTGTSTGSTGGDTGLSDCKDRDGETDWVCCEAQDWQPAEHCTPWGPPAPPTFVRRAPLSRLV